MTTVYRVQPDEGAVTGGPSTLAYRPMRRGHGSSAMGFFTLTSPLVAAALVALVGLPELALPVMAATGVAIYVVRRREKERPAATLQLRDGTLHVRGPSGRELAAVPLAELLDITLDTKTIEIVQESPGPVPELMYVNSTVGPALDTSRLQLITRRDGAIPLTDDHMPHSDSLEWRGKMRQFLRKHGWKPEEPGPRPGDARRSTRRDDAPTTHVASVDDGP